MGFIYLNHCR